MESKLLDLPKATFSKDDLICIIDKECVTRDFILDVGCGRGEVLYNCEKKGFRNLIGFDKSESLSTDQDILQMIADSLKADYTAIAADAESHLSKYSLYRSDYTEFPFEKWKFDCIVCNHFLHFIPDEQKYMLIERMYKALSASGIMLIRVNHHLNPSETDPAKTVKIGKNTYRGLKFPFDKEVRYLAQIEEFTKALDIYPQLRQHNFIDERGIFKVIKKI